MDNINQPFLAVALTESLEIAGKLPANALTTTNYGICATVNNKIVVKAPDWGYVPSIRVPREEVKHNYTPWLQGDIPAIVMEFLCDVASIPGNQPILLASGSSTSKYCKFPTVLFLSRMREC